MLICDGTHSHAVPNLPLADPGVFRSAPGALS